MFHPTSKNCLLLSDRNQLCEGLSSLLPPSEHGQETGLSGTDLRDAHLEGHRLWDVRASARRETLESYPLCLFLITARKALELLAGRNLLSRFMTKARRQQASSGATVAPWPVTSWGSRGALPAQPHSGTPGRPRAALAEEGGGS